jgi:hypothetical protein
MIYTMRILGVISRMQRANAAPALSKLRATAGIAVHTLTHAAELRCLALLHPMYDRRALAMAPAVLQNARHSAPYV